MNRKIKKLLHQVVSFSLAMVMLTGSVVGDVQIMRAEELDELPEEMEIAPEEEAPIVHPEDTIKIFVSDGARVENADIELEHNGDISERFDQDGVVHVPYGNVLSFTTDLHKEHPNPAVFDVYYAEQSDYEANPESSLVIWSKDQILQPGNYYFHILLDITGEDSIILTSATERKFGVVIDKAKLKTPELSLENGSKLVLGDVSTTEDGVDAKANIKGSKIFLYREIADSDDELIYSAQLEKDVNEVELDQQLLAAGPGSYYMLAQAIVNEGCGEMVDSDVCAKENAVRTKVVSIKTKKDGGIESILPGEEDETLLITGNSATSVDLSANVASGLGFQCWTAYDGESIVEDSGITVTPSMTSNSIHVSLDSSYKSGNALVFHASTKDITNPIISTFEVGENEGKKVLSASVIDHESGIFAYAFTKSTEKLSAEDSSFINLDEVVSKEPVSLSFNPTESGTYYLNVKDHAGNVTKSDVGIKVTVLTYHNVIENGILGTQTEMIFGTKDYDLTIPARMEYSFDSFYYGTVSANAIEANRIENNKIPADKISSLGTDEGIDVYANWTRNDVIFKEQPKNVGKVYDGKAEVLSAKLDNSASAVYQWYRKIGAEPYEPIADANSASLTVKDTKDSGKYYLKASITVDGEERSATTDEIEVLIEKAPLSVHVKDQTIFYGDAVPTDFTYQYSGFVADEDESCVTEGTVNVEGYTQGAGKGLYNMVPSGFLAENYDIEYKNGVLTVGAKSIENVVCSISANEFVYDRTEKRPEVTVSDEGKILVKGVDYDLVYLNNVNASTEIRKASVVITFKGNYAGTKKLEFTIHSVSPVASISMNGWTYGDTASVPVLSVKEENLGTITDIGKVTYYYLDSENQPLPDQPRDAGEYSVYAKIESSTNYSEMTTTPVKFKIEKRDLVIVTESASKQYDGNPLIQPNYSYIGSFAPGESFLSISV